MKALVAGAGGFIGGHLVARLIADGINVTAVDKKPLTDWYQLHKEADSKNADLSILTSCREVVKGQDVIYNLAADMGGMGFIENNKALCMLSSLINTHLLLAAKEFSVSKYFYASSACVYASWHQEGTDINGLREEDAYPADPEDGYGWEKLFGERMCRHFNEDFGIEVYIARFHNVYGPYGTWDGGREKAPAAACRKVLQALDSDRKVSVWGDGQQVRSFTYIDDAVEGVMKLLNSGFHKPINLGSAECVTINHLYQVVEELSGHGSLTYEHELDAPLGVRGRSSDNKLCREILNWEPTTSLREGMESTFKWIKAQYEIQKQSK